MTYESAMDFINESAQYGSKLGLESIEILLKYLDNPESKQRYIHVAGTNGKGSTSSFINSVLVKAGYNVGLYTSPHLISFNEVIRFNSEYITNEELANATSLVSEGVQTMIGDGHDHPTQYEIITAIAFVYFMLKKADIVILEVGMGGRLDATNAIKESLVSVITPISMDHVGFLGDTIAKVASEKAGIIKESGRVVVARQVTEAMEVIENKSKGMGAKLYKVDYSDIDIDHIDESGAEFSITIQGREYRDISISLIGKHQVENAVLALNVLEILRDEFIELHDISIKLGLKEASWPCRLELVETNPKVLLDGAHNLDGARALRNTINHVLDYDRLVLMIGILGDKDIEGVLGELLPLCDEVVFTKPLNPRACDPNDLIEYAEKHDKEYIVEEDIIKAYEAAKSNLGVNDMLLCCGSLYMIGKIRDYIKG